MNIVESKLYFTTPPLSIRHFNQRKNVKEHKEALDGASMYIIGKREVPRMKVLEHSPVEEFIKNDVAVDRYIILNIEMREVGFNIDIVYILSDNMKKADFISAINEITVEELFSCAARGIGAIGCNANLAPLITYEVLYVGECVGEPLTKRFRAHHALQNMLIEENVISRDYDKAEELILMPIWLDSDVISSLTPGNMESDGLKVFTNDFDFGSKEVTLDAKKALVHNMNPKYNKTRFINYPKSTNGLYGTDAHVFSYALAEYAMLKYSDGIVIGCPDVMFASKIVGDDEGFTKIYKPLDDVTERYVPRIMSYMGEELVNRYYRRTEE